MACRDYEDGVDVLLTRKPKQNSYTIEIDKLKTELAKVTAIACALSRVYFTDAMALSEVNWEEAGVSFAEYEAWWTKHKQEDAERIEREKAAALAKLTPAERKLLGLV